MVIQEFKQNGKGFPHLLGQIYDSPKEIFIRGQLPELPMLAVVGTRKPTTYGQQITYQICYDLAKSGIAIVSGLAFGIDGIAHQAALDAGGITVAVLGHGLDHIYPASHNQLAQRIIQSNGALVSEYANGTPPLKHHFPARNRIISGISLMTLVTEADATSGSLITANFALQQNRAVAAIPGPITSPRSAGPNNLIKNGAITVTSAVDILTALELEQPTAKTVAIKANSPEEQSIMTLIQNGTNSFDGLIESVDIDPDQLATIISLMEITGKIKNLGAGNWVLTNQGG